MGQRYDILNGLRCGIRTHIFPRPKRGAITRLGESEKLVGPFLGLTRRYVTTYAIIW